MSKGTHQCMPWENTSRASQLHQNKRDNERSRSQKEKERPGGGDGR